MPDPLAISPVPIDHEVDARGHFDPGPLWALIRALNAVPVGSVVSVLSSDPGSAQTIPAWIVQAGHEYLGTYAMEGYLRLVLRKSH